MQGFPPQCIHSTVEQEEQPALTGFFEGLNATEMEPLAAQRPISAPDAENEGTHVPSILPGTSLMLGAVPPGWNSTVGVRCPACQWSQLICKPGCRH